MTPQQLWYIFERAGWAEVPPADLAEQEFNAFWHNRARETEQPDLPKLMICTWQRILRQIKSHDQKQN